MPNFTQEEYESTAFSIQYASGDRQFTLSDMHVLLDMVASAMDEADNAPPCTSPEALTQLRKELQQHANDLNTFANMIVRNYC